MTARITYQDLPKGLMDGMMKTEMYFKKPGSDLRLLALMQYRVSQINRCGYCLDMHHKDAISHGETELRLHSLAAWKECPYYTEKERAVLALAETLTNTSTQEVEDEFFHTLSTFSLKKKSLHWCLRLRKSIAGTGSIKPSKQYPETTHPDNTDPSTFFPLLNLKR